MTVDDKNIVGKSRKDILRGFLMKELVWSQAWPMQVGRFWFYGCRHYLDEAALHLVEVVYGEAGWRYTINGEFMRYEASSVGTVMAMPTVTPSPTATVAPVVKATVHVYCAGEVEMCQTGWCAEMCRERVYTESHHGLQYKLKGE